MSMDEAMTFIDAEPTLAVQRSSGGLTPREVEVAVLVGRHHTNREIGRILCISVRTAESHIDHILAKLGLSNRLDLATWAREQGLVAEEIGS